MLFILRTLLDPGLDLRLVGRRELQMGFWRRHHVVLVGRKDAFPDNALRQVACHDGRPVLVLARGIFGKVQSQLGLAGFLIGSVATKAVLRKNRADVPVELDVLSLNGHDGVQAEEEGELQGAMHLVFRQRRAGRVSICIVVGEPRVFALPLGWRGRGDGVDFGHPLWPPKSSLLPVVNSSVPPPSR